MKTTSTTPPLAVSCLCRAVCLPAHDLLEDSSQHLPLGAELCYCDSCRRTSGALMGCFVKLDSGPPAAALSLCVGYASSDEVTRYFCAKCGSHVFFRRFADETTEMWFAWGASLDLDEPRDAENTKNLMKVNTQIHINDTVDGGLFGRMVETSSLAAESSSGTGESTVSTRSLFGNVHAGPLTEPTLSADAIVRLASQLQSQARQTHDDSQQNPRDLRVETPLLAECHCSKIKFRITRPTAGKQYPDHVQEHYVKPLSRKWVARLCCCHSCTTSTGSPIHPWTYVPPEHMSTMAGEPLSFVSSGGKSQLDSLKQYESRKGTTWSFCGTCGATIFYERADRSHVIDVAIGVLRSSVGSLAEDFVEWEWHASSYVEECRATSLFNAIVGGEDAM